MRWARHPAFGAAVASALVAALCWAARNEQGRGVYESAERSLLDLRFGLRGPTPSRGEVAIVAFDDATAARAGKLLERRAG